MDREEIVQLIREEVREAFDARDGVMVYGPRIAVGSIKARHISENIVFFGDGDRPTDNSTGVYAHFDTGTGVLSVWDGSAWLETTLT